MKPNEIDSIKQQNREKILPSIPMIMVGMGTCGIGNGAENVFAELQKQIDSKNIPCKLKQTGCFGFCAQEPVVMLYQPQKPLLVYSQIEKRCRPDNRRISKKKNIYPKSSLQDRCMGFSYF